MRRQRHTPARARGFTLVEAIAAMSVIVALSSVGSAVVYSGIRSCRGAYASAQLHEEVSTAMERVVRELRCIAPNTSAPVVGAAQISSVTGTSISFGSGSSVTLSGGALVFSDSGAAAVTLLRDVTSFSLRCYDESNAALPSSLSGSGCYPIRRIEVTLGSGREGSTETVRTRVFIRGSMEGDAP
jgi:type II secretory pathway pseudopilin PulG